MTMQPWIIAGAATPEIAEQLVSERPEAATQEVVEAIVQRITATGEQKREWYNEIYAPQMGVEVPTTQPQLDVTTAGISEVPTLTEFTHGLPVAGEGVELELLTAGLPGGLGGLEDIFKGAETGAAIGGALAGTPGAVVGAVGGGAISYYTGGEGMIVRNGGAITLGGPGVPEPPAGMVAKAWKTKAFSHTVGEYWVYFWKLIDGRIVSWNAAKREAKMWRPKKPIVLYRGKITLSQAVKTQRMLDRLWHTVARKTKALKLA
jgi:hypothetical protein